MGYMGERTEEKVARKLAKKQKLVNVAAKRMKADLVLKNATYLNVFSSEFCVGDIAVSDGLIAGVGEYEGVREVDVSGKFVCPGLIDAHIHLESSMVSPAEFARAVVRHGHDHRHLRPARNRQRHGRGRHPLHDGGHRGTAAGRAFHAAQLRARHRHGRKRREARLPRHRRMVRPSARAGSGGDDELRGRDPRRPVRHFADSRQPGASQKIDGHAPGLSGAELNAYIAAGVYSDHECYTFENALEKLRLGQFIMIREGTAAKNLKALAPILTQARESRCMFATDDKHPIDLLTGGHIDYIIKEAIARGVDPVIAIKVASHNAARYFLLNNKGAIAPGYLADMVVFDDFRSFNVLQVFKRGREVFDGET